MAAKPAATSTGWIDPDDAPELTDEELDEADLYEGDTLIRAGKRGRPKAGQRKVLLSLRLDTQVIEGFRATGPGWQSRINDALRDHLRRRAS